MNTHSHAENQYENAPRGYLWSDDLIAKRDALLFDPRSFEEKLADLLAECGEHDEESYEGKNATPLSGKIANPTDTAETVVAAGAGVVFATPPTSAHSSTPHNPPHHTPSDTSLTPSTDTEKQEKEEASKKPARGFSAPWKRATSLQKLASSVFVAAEKNGRAFSLNLSLPVESTLIHSKNPARDLSHRINAALKGTSVEGTPYSFVIEAAPEGRVHAHGVFVCGDAELPAMKAALRKAGGKIGGEEARRQLRVSGIEAASGWLDYITQDLRKTEKALTVDKEKLIFLSQPMTKVAKLFHDERRRSTQH